MQFVLGTGMSSNPESIVVMQFWRGNQKPIVSFGVRTDVAKALR